MRTTSWLGLLVALTVAATAGHGLAGVAVSPLKCDLTAAPGEEAEFSITVTHNSADGTAQAQPIAVFLGDLDIAQDGRIRFPKPGTTSRSAAGWITLSESSFSLRPREAKQVRCTVRIPYGESGERYAVVLTNTGAPQKSDGLKVMIQHQVATIVFLSIKGRTFPKSAEVEAVRVLVPALREPQGGMSLSNAEKPKAERDPSMETSGAKDPPTVAPLRVVATVRNKGEVNFVGQGEARLRAADGDRRAYPTLKLESPTQTILPACRRDYAATISYDLPAGKYQVEAMFDYDNKWRKAYGKAEFELKQAYHAQSAPAGKTPDAAPRIEPPQVALSLPPGATRNVVLTACNPSLVPAVFSARIEAETPGEEGWLAVPPVVTLRQKSTANIRLTVRTPDRLVGPHKFSLIFESDGRAKIVIPISISLPGGTRPGGAK